jgi:hypothetical protein
VSADLQQAAAHKGDICGGIEIEQLAERVEQQHFAPRSGGLIGALRTAHEADTGLRECLRNFGKPWRMARRNHQQRIRMHLAHAPRGRKHRLLLIPAVRAASHPQRPRARVLLAQPRGARRDVSG